MDYPTFYAAKAAAQQFKDMGWTVLRADIPMQCAFGFIAFRMENGKEVTHRFMWLPLGDEPQVQKIMAKDLSEYKAGLDKVRPLGIYPCDDPVQRLLGYVAYDLANKVCYIIQIPLTRWKSEEYSQIQFEQLIHIAFRDSDWLGPS